MNRLRGRDLQQDRIDAHHGRVGRPGVSAALPAARLRRALLLLPAPLAGELVRFLSFRQRRFDSEPRPIGPTAAPRAQ
jgi:hypothetical protein